MHYVVMNVLQRTYEWTYHKQQKFLFFNNSTAAEEGNKEDDGTTAQYNENSSGIQVVANNVCHKVPIDCHVY